jgi:hypothetical protein
MKSQKKKPQFAARKKAFDDVMEMYRSSRDTTGIGAVDVSGGGKATAYHVKPTLTDFRCDVDKVIMKCTVGVLRLRFVLTYIQYDSESSIDMEKHADIMLGSGRHNLEQGMGAEFIKRGIYPLRGGRGYFHCVRKPRGIV